MGSKSSPKRCMVRSMKRRKLVWCVRTAAILLLMAPPGCDGDGEEADPTCCERVYPVWCVRFAECDPVTFFRAWNSPDQCSSQQIEVCQGGEDAEGLCTGRTRAQTEACRAALGTASCDDLLFRERVFPAACRR